MVSGAGGRPGWDDAAEMELGAALGQMFGGRSDEEREQRYVDAARLLDVLRPLLTARDAAVRANDARLVADEHRRRSIDGDYAAGIVEGLSVAWHILIREEDTRA